MKGLKNLRLLSLSNTSITDAGLAHVSGFTKLRVLQLGGTRITNAEMLHLRGFVDLRYVDLAPSEVTDAGVENLWGLKRLETAYLPNHITQQAEKRLRQEVPSATGSRFDKELEEYLKDPPKK